MSNGYYYEPLKTNTNQKYCSCFKKKSEYSETESCSLGLLGYIDGWERRKRDVSFYTAASSSTFDIDDILSRSNITMDGINELIDRTHLNDDQEYDNSTSNSCETLLGQDSLLIECDRRGIIKLNNKIDECLLDFNVSIRNYQKTQALSISINLLLIVSLHKTMFGQRNIKKI